MAHLTRFNLATAADAVVRVHALVQHAVRDVLTPTDAATTIRAAAAALREIWPDIELDPILTALLRANAAVVTDRPDADALWAADNGAHPLLFRAVTSLGEAGQLTSAIAAATRLHDQAGQYLGPDHPDTLATRSYLARWRGEAGDPAGTVRSFEQLLLDRERVLGPDHPHTLNTCSYLARWRGKAGDPASAATVYEQLLPDAIRVLGPDHPDTLTTRSNLAHWRGEAGDPDGAVAAYEQLLLDSIRVLGPDHPDTLTTRHNLVHWQGEVQRRP